jgi:uncharacterized protein
MSVFSNYQKLIQKIDQLCNKIQSLYKEHINCNKGCSKCCINDLTLFPVEFDHIKEKIKHNKIKPNKSKDDCVMLDKGRCQIYEHRPLVCRTQGYPLLYGEELSLCEINFKDMNGAFCFSAGTLIDMNKVNSVLAAVNLEYLKEANTLNSLKNKRYDLWELIKQ